MKKGTMQPVKKVLGAILGIVGIGFLLKGIPLFSPIRDLTLKYEFIFSIVLLVSSYLLYISGRQK